MVTGSVLSLSLSGTDGGTAEDEVPNCAERTKAIVRRKLPILQWLPQYKRSYILADLLAGVTVWLTAVPQSMAYAGIAGLSPEYGLYSHFVGPFLYIFLGGCRQVTIGPTAVVELLTFQTCGENFADCVILMGFYSGVIELVLGILHLGFIISFISEPVTTGFTAGASITIASSQIKSILGLQGKSMGSGFIPTWRFIVKYIDTIKLGDTILGLICVVFLITLQKLKDIKPPNCGNPDTWTKALKVLALCRNALAIFLTSIVAVAWSDPPFALVGTVKKGFPEVGLPVFELVNPHGNSTEPMSFTETLGFLWTGPLVVAFIAILQNVAISKAFGSGQTIDGTQEMVALGATNIIGGFFRCLPTSGSFTRSAVNEASGVKSPLNGIYVGSLILLSLWVLTPTFQYIPKASLGAVIISAVIFMIDFSTMSLLWKASKTDFLCCMVTLISSLGLGMEYGILVGAGVSILIILLRSLRPAMTVEFGRDRKTGLRYLLLKPDQGLYFPSIDFLRDRVNKYASQYENYAVIVIQCDKWTQWDFTAANSIISLCKSLEKNGKTLILYKHSQVWPEAFMALGASKPICCSDTCDLIGTLRKVGGYPRPTDSVQTDVEDDMEVEDEQSPALPK